MNPPSIQRASGIGPCRLAALALLVVGHAATCTPTAVAAGFSHQSYQAPVAENCYTIVKSPEQVDADQAFRDFNRMIEQRRIARLLLVHGTFGGDDGLGLLSMAADRAPALLTLLGINGDDLRVINKAWKDALDGVDGFNTAYAAEFNRQLNRPDFVDGTFVWGSENNHLDRAHAAVRLLHRLLETKLPPDAGIMLWGHSHAGNVFALVTHLLANDPDARERFFEIGRTVYGDDPAWRAVYRELTAIEGPHPLGSHLDIVTFGTPVRYAWNRRGYRGLLHFVHHRTDEEAAIDVAPYRTKVVCGLDAIRSARYGDWVQAFAIDGTDAPPLNPTRREANAAYAKLFTAFAPPPENGGVLMMLSYWTRLIAYLQRSWGARVSAQGHTMLVDYGESAQRLLGHGVYMDQAWLPFHAGAVARYLCGEAAGNQP